MEFLIAIAAALATIAILQLSKASIFKDNLKTGVYQSDTTNICFTSKEDLHFTQNGCTRTVPYEIITSDEIKFYVNNQMYYARFCEDQRNQRGIMALACSGPGETLIQEIIK